MSLQEHYTTLTVTEFNKMATVITALRWKVQKARELLEEGRAEEAKALLAKLEDE